MGQDDKEYTYHYSYKQSRRQAEVFLESQVKLGMDGTIYKKRDDLYEIVTREPNGKGDANMWEDPTLKQEMRDDFFKFWDDKSKFYDDVYCEPDDDDD